MTERTGTKPFGIEWPTVAMIAVCYGLFLFSAAILWPVSGIAALAVMAVASALHSSLQHEVLHGHPTRSPAINEALVFLPLAPFYPYRRFRALHLRHHCDERLTDPYDDPESWYRDGHHFARMPAVLRAVLTFNNTFIGRMVIGPLLSLIAFISTDVKRLLSGDRAVIRGWVLHALGLMLLATILERGFGVPFSLYVLVAGYLGASLISIRTYLEHRAEDDVAMRTAIVESRILSILFLNNNLHAVHHALPREPWYLLPKLHDQAREQWADRNGQYIYSSYFDIVKRYAFRAKEPVAHPAYPSETSASVTAAPGAGHVPVGGTSQPPR